MNIYIDIEALRAPEEKRQQILEEVKGNFKAPSSITKGEMAKDLGLSDKDAKFISAGDMKAKWESEMAEAKSGEVAQERWEKTSFNPELAPIACICISYTENQTANKKSFDLLEYKTERNLLAEFNDFIKHLCSANGAMINKPYFIGHNITKFDLPFIWKRSVINDVETVKGVKWIDARHEQHCYDTMIAWSGCGNRISADNLAKLLGVQGKSDMDGSQVYDTWQTDPQKVIDYCHDDVAIVKAIHERLTK